MKRYEVMVRAHVDVLVTIEAEDERHAGDEAVSEAEEFLGAAVGSAGSTVCRVDDVDVDPWGDVVREVTR